VKEVVYIKTGLLFFLLIYALVSVTVSTVVPTNNTVQLIAHDDFENGFSSYWYRAMNDFSYSGNPSTSHSISPTHSYRFELHSTDPLIEGGMRSELEGASESPFQERIYNFSIYLPNGGTEDYALDKYDCDEIIAQWHTNPDPGEVGTMPPLSLHTTTNVDGTGHYFLMRIWDDKPMSTNSELKADGKVTCYDLGSYEGDKGKWVNWSFYVKWGWLQSQNPMLEVYKDGNLILNLDGLPNTMNDQKGINQQFGIYKWEWDGSYSPCTSKLTKRVIYFDDVSVLQVNQSFPPLQIKAAPVASFSVSSISGKHPLTVKFTDTSTGNITSWSWSFGDGKTASTQNTTHVYSSRGTYTSKLTISNSAGSSTVTKKIRVV